MFYYSEGPEDGNGYTFWIDEVKFENLGTVAHPKSAITVSYTHLRAHETVLDLVCRLLLEKKKYKKYKSSP